jgi:hypothetical protein
MNNFNRGTKIIYLMLIVIPLVYFAISVYSYFSVYNTFGHVPSSQDFTLDLIGSSGKEFKIFPIYAGRFIIMLYLFSILLTLIYTPALLLIKYFNTSIRIHKWLALTLIGVQFIVYMLNGYDFADWYSIYVLD